MKINIAGLVNDSVVDGPGLRLSIFVQGCPHNCLGCHNPETHDYNNGTHITTEEILEKVTSNPLLSGVTFSGGEPFVQAEVLSYLGGILQQNGYNIVTYTGYTFEELISNATSKNFYMPLLSVTDYLIDGKFENDKKSYLLKFKGSSNQRILDCKKSLTLNTAIETDF